MWWPETLYQAPKPGSVPLGKFSAFKSDDLDEAREFVGSVFCPHRLNPVNKRCSTSGVRMNHVPVAGMSLNYLKYGTAVEIEPGELDSFFLVQVQLGGQVDIDCGQQRAAIHPGHASLLSPSEYTHMLWNGDSASLMVRLERQTVERQLAAFLGDHLPRPLVFDLDMDCTTGPAAAWWRAVQFLVAELELGENVMNSPLGAKQFEQSLVSSLLYGHRHNYTDALTHGLSKAAPRHVKLVENYIHANAGSDITIVTLTEISGVSARALFAGFKQFRGTSPMKYLRDVRLARVKSDLEKASSGQTVTEIAMNWGFCQLGRFAVEYKRTFGESPSETLRSSPDAPSHNI